MPNHSSVTLVGHIAEPKITGEGDNMCARFSLAVTRKRKAGDLTTWWSVTCWRKDAAFVAQYVKKGALLLVEGEPYNELYQEKLYLKVDARRVINLTAKEMPIVIEEDAPAPKPTRAKPVAATGSDEPPFARPLIPDAWG